VRLILGDCLEAMRALPDGSVDAVIADPPYGTTACKWDAVIPFAPMWEQLRRVAKPNAAIVLFAAQPFTSALVMSNPREFRYEWVWHKSHPAGFLLSKHRPLAQHESLVVFSQRKHLYTPQMTTGPRKVSRTGEWESERKSDSAYHGRPAILARVWSDQYYPTTVLSFSCGRRADSVHPTQKPVDLLSYLVRTYTNPGETVLDFCMGSGTTGVACLQEGRDFIGIEREAAYFQIAERRIAAAQPPLFAAAD
jgi:DNA modification methylase